MMACYYCGTEVGSVPFSTGRAACAEHKIPKSKGGSSLACNIVTACNVCNSIKGSSTVDEARYRLVQKLLGWPRFNPAQLEWLRIQGFDLSAYDGAELAFERLARDQKPST